MNNLVTPAAEAETVGKLLDDGISFLESFAIDEAVVRTEWLLSSLLRIPRPRLRLEKNSPITEEQSSRFNSWLHRCADGEPVQYITGEIEFFGLPFKIDEDVLIPRPETERLVEVAAETAALTQPCSALEIGTGSGCIAISLAHTCPGVSIDAVDNSEAAIRLARRNSEKNDVGDQISFRQFDILNNEPDSQYDLIVSNPPYVPLGEYTLLNETVRCFEPKTALTDDSDGLTFYRRFSRDGWRWLRSGGVMILEVGRNDHPEKAADLFRTAEWQQVELIQDYNGDPRVLRVCRI